MQLISRTATLTAAAILACAQADGQPQTYEFERVVTGIRIPWGMTWLDDGDMLVTDRHGQLYRVSDGRLSDPIAAVPEVYLNGQSGLLDVLAHPDYATNGWIYLAYASSTGGGVGGNTAIMRAKLERNSLVDQQVLYKAVPNTDSRDHFGSRIVFDRKGFLFFSIGDRYARDVNPQDISKDGGKIYRLFDDGEIPEDNPFYRQSGAKLAIYSYGHRNPQGMAVHPETGEIWAHEHGPKGGDEINVIRAGRNYGWPVISYGIDYDDTIIADGTHKQGMEQPLWQWTPSIAPSGMAFVTSDRYPELQEKLIVGSLKFSNVSVCELLREEVSCERNILDGIGRVRNVKQGPDRFIYVAVDGSGIFRIRRQ